MAHNLPCLPACLPACRSACRPSNTTRLVSGLLLAGIIASAAAQEAPGTLEKRFEKPPEPLSTPKPLLVPLQDQRPPAEAARLRFKLRAVRIDGNRAFSAAGLEPLYARFLGREISLADAYQIRDAITAKYGAAGYGLSKAIVPPQEIATEGAVLHLQVLEGYIDAVSLQAPGPDGRPAEIDPAARHPWLQAMIERIKAERPIRAATLERYLLLINDRFAWKATSTLAPGGAPNASRLILRIEPAPKYDASLSLDNRGTESVGPWQITTSLSLNGLGGRSAQTALSYITTQETNELKYLSLSHTEILGPEGTSLNLSYTGSESEPGDATSTALGQESDSATWSLKLAHPFIRTRQRNLSGHVRFDYKDTESYNLGALATDDKTRVLRAGVNYDRADAYNGINQVLTELSWGLDALDATPYGSSLKSRADGHADFQKITLNLSRKQELGYFNEKWNRWSIQAAFMAQYAGQGLLSGEECGVGGQQFGRAYDSSEILGDSCAAVSLETRYAAGTQGTPFEYAQWYGFWDGGAIYNREPLSATDDKRKDLSSAGLGVRFGIGKRFSGSLELDKPLTRDVANEGNRDPRLFATFTAKF